MKAYSLTEREKKILAAYVKGQLGLRGDSFRLLRYKTRLNTNFIDERGYVIASDGARFEPYEEQEAFVRSTAPLSLFIGGRGSGKTTAGVQKALLLALSGKSGLVVNPDFQNLVFSTWNEFRRWLPPAVVVKEHRRYLDPAWKPHTSFYIMLTNGAVIWFKGTRSDESAVGGNVNWVWVDEAARSSVGDPVLRALANARVGDNPQRFITTTPKGKYSITGETHWLYEIYDRGVSGKDKTIAIFLGDSSKNRFVHASYRSMLERIYGVGTPLYAQEVLGLFVENGQDSPDVSKIQIIRHIDEERFMIGRRVRFWDLAATKSAHSDFTVGTRVAEIFSRESGATYWVVEDQFVFKGGYQDFIKNLAMISRMDGNLVAQVFEQEPGASGKLFIDAIKDVFKGEPDLEDIPINYLRPIGNRVHVARITWYPILDRVFLIIGDWNADFLGEMAVFPQGAHDDRVTSFTGAMVYLLSSKRPRAHSLDYIGLGSVFTEVRREPLGFPFWSPY